MSDVVICKYNEIDVDNFLFGKPLKHEGRYHVNLTHKVNANSLAHKIYMQTPVMKLHTELNQKFADFVCPSNSGLTNMMSLVDAKMLKKVKENKENWFDEKCIEDSFFEVGQYPSIKPDTETTSIIQLRTPEDTVVYNQDKEVINVKDVPKESCVSAILQLAGIWFTKTRWGLTWRTVQLRTHKKNGGGSSVKTYMFTDQVEYDGVVSPPPGTDV